MQRKDSGRGITMNIDDMKVSDFLYLIDTLQEECVSKRKCIMCRYHDICDNNDICSISTPDLKKAVEAYAEMNGLLVDFSDKKDLHIRKLEKALDKACELLEKHRIGTTCDEENYKKCMENHCFNSCIHLRNMTKEECKEWCMKDE